MLFCKSNAAHTNCVTTTGVYHAIPAVAANKGWLVCYSATNGNSCDASTAANPNPIAIHDAYTSQMTLISSSALPIHFNPNGTQGTGTAVTLTLALVNSDGSALAATSYATSNITSISATGTISKTP